ncbi:MAG TPA: tetratricopeptide repeat protein [Pyrinomonadaceae bacterium]|nr:tetratricopeptide repeat protein [Pyrinomonadaceae bacterium]
MSRAVSRLLFALLFTAACAAPAPAQREGNPFPLRRTITGQVRFAQGGAPAENIIVRLERLSGGYVGEERTDRLGKFRFTGLVAEQYVVSVRMPGYREVRRQVQLETNPSDYLQLQLAPEKADGAAPAPDARGRTRDANVPAEAYDELEKGRAALLNGKKVDEALPHLEKAVSIYPRFFEAQLLLGTVYMDAGRWEQSAAALGRAREINPKSAAALFALGEVYRRQKKYEEAERVLNEGLAVDEKSAAGHYTLGRVYWDRGDYLKAGPRVGRALQLKPDFAEAHLLAGNILLRARQGENALTEFQEYLRLAPEGEFAAQARQMVEKIKKALSEKNK